MVAYCQGKMGRKANQCFFHFIKQTIGTKNIVYYVILENRQFNYHCDTKRE